MSEENKALVRRLVDEAINGGRPELVEDLFAPGAGRAGSAGVQELPRRLPPLAGGDRRPGRRGRQGGGEVSLFRHLPGRVHGVAPNGRRQEVDEIFFLRVREGRFVEYWGLEDNVMRLRQLGVVS